MNNKKSNLKFNVFFEKNDCDFHKVVVESIVNYLMNLEDEC